MKKLLITALAVLPVLAFSQIGGRHIYDFLNFAPQARIAALGGVNISTYDNDQNFAYQNPALLNDSMHNRVSLSYVNQFGDINYGYVSYSRSWEKIGDFHAGLQYVNYGKIAQTDEIGNRIGFFTANDVALVIGGSRKVHKFRIGANVKFINSNIAGYNSFTGLAFDLGGLYVSDNDVVTVGITFNNMGVQFEKYDAPNGSREPLPFEIRVGTSVKPPHMPVRFSITATNLQQPVLIYRDPNAPPQFDLSGEEIPPDKKIAENIFGHFVFATEFLLGKNIRVRAGYNHLRRAELRTEGKASISGFSFGAGLRIKKFYFDYGFAHYHLLGGTHSISIGTGLDRFKKKNNSFQIPD